MKLSVMLCAALGGFLFGYDTTVINGALFQMKDYFGFDSHDWKYALIVAIAIAAAFVGAFLAGFIAARFGRRPCIASADVLFIAGSIIMSCAPNVGVILFSRVLVGLAIGISSATIPVYLAEVTSPKHRGATIVLNTFVLTGAQFLAAGFTALMVVYTDVNVGWRIAVGIGAVPAIVQLVCLLLFLPESPRWLMCNGNELLAKSVAERFNVDLGEYDNYELQSVDLNYKSLLAPDIRGRVLLSSALQIIQQFSGINTIMYYSSVILYDAGFHDAIMPVILSCPLAFMNVLFTLVAIFTVDRVGRRPLILYSCLGCLITTLVIAIVGYFIGNVISFTVGGWVYIALLLLFLGCYAPGIGCIPWVVMGEIFPTHLRTSAASVATMANWGSNALVSQVFPILMGAIGPGGTFTIICGLLLLSVIFIYFCVVETKNKSLEELDVMFRQRAGLPIDTRANSHAGEDDFDHYGNQLNEFGESEMVNLGTNSKTGSSYKNGGALQELADVSDEREDCKRDAQAKQKVSSNTKDNDDDDDESDESKERKNIKLFAQKGKSDKARKYHDSVSEPIDNNDIDYSPRESGKN